MPTTTQQVEYSTAKLGDHCPLCGKGALVISPSGLNLHCDTCHQITVLPLAHSPEARPYSVGHGRTHSGPKKRF